MGRQREDARAALHEKGGTYSLGTYSLAQEVGGTYSRRQGQYRYPEVSDKLFFTDTQAVPHAIPDTLSVSVVPTTLAS
jgi:hypothetical protein